jgi:guanine deaminase
LAEELFILQTMGDDRCVREVYVSGKAMKTKGKRADTIAREQLQLA